MRPVVDFAVQNPELVGVIVAVAESIIMPFIPVKWDGLAVTLFSVFKKKKVN